MRVPVAAVDVVALVLCSKLAVRKPVGLVAAVIVEDTEAVTFATLTVLSIEALDVAVAVEQIEEEAEGTATVSVLLRVALEARVAEKNAVVVAEGSSIVTER